MVAAGLTAHGHVAGRFMSPHVESFNERIAVDGALVSDAQVVEFVAMARQQLAAEPPAYELRPAFFELTLALALWVFAAADVSHAVLEAGVGGAADATSAAVRRGSEGNLRLVVLTNVDLDHIETLGTTVEEIAAEKAGALVEGVPAITGAAGRALEVIKQIAEERGSPLYIDDGHESLFELPPGVAARAGEGSTWRANARLAAAALRLLGASHSAVVESLNSPPLPARGERFEVEGRVVILDGAHDPAAASRLAAEVTGEAGRGYVLLFGSLSRKQGVATLEPLAAAATAIVVTAVDQGDDLMRFAAPGRELIVDPALALRRALALTAVGDVLLVAGSLYLAGTLRPLLRSPTA